MCRVVVMSRPVSFRAVSDCMGRRGLQAALRKALRKALKMVIQTTLKSTLKTTTQTTRGPQHKR